MALKQGTYPQGNSSRGRRRLTGEERRQHLLEVALHLFAERGFEGTTTKAIGKASGISESNIFHHFANKEELYSAILEYKSGKNGMEVFLDELRGYAESKNDEGLFLALSSKILEAYRVDPKFRRLMLYASLERHAIAKLANQMFGLPVFDFLCDYIRIRQQEGAFQTHDARLIVVALVAMPVYYAQVTRLFGIKLLEAPDKEIAETFVHLLLDGLRTRKN